MDKEIRKKVDEFEDAEESIYSAELFLLRKIHEASSDLMRGRYDKDFCNACGGMQKLIDLHDEATSNFEEWINEGQG